MDAEERYWSKVAVAGDDECWRWTASVNPCGYGTFRSPGDQLAHRFGWRLAFGDIPNGLCVCHRCDNPACQNPKHLFLGTPADNSADKVAKGRQSRVSQPGETNPRARLRDHQIDDIRRRYESGESQESLASAYGVAQSAISRTVRGVAWTHRPVRTPVDARFRKTRGERHPNMKLTDQQVIEIRVTYDAGGVTQATLAALYGVSDQAISAIVRRVSRV